VAQTAHLVLRLAPWSPGPGAAGPPAPRAFRQCGAARPRQGPPPAAQVNALSSNLLVEVWRGGRRAWQRYSRGAPLGPLQQEALAEELKGRRGTRVSFRYDDQIFAEGVAFDPDTIRARIRELAFLNSAATLRFRAAPGGGGAGAEWQVYHYDGGLREYVTWLNSSREPLHEPICVNRTKDSVQVGGCRACACLAGGPVLEGGEGEALG
jgi:hypothetical protein